MRTNYAALVFAVVFIGIFWNNARAAEPDSWPEPLQLGRDVGRYIPPTDPDGTTSAQPLPDEPTGPLTLSHALGLALMRNPEVQSFSWEVRVGEARRLTADAMPNPEVEVALENFAGVGYRSGFEAAETSLRLSQLVELGGKRAARARLADMDTKIAGWDYEAKRIELFGRVATAFLEVVAAQDRLLLQQEVVQTAEQVYTTVSERVKAGKVSPIEETRAAVALSSARLQLDKASRELNMARINLASTWGSRLPVFERADGRLDAISPLPTYEQLAALAARNPDIARWTVETQQREAAIELEKSKAIPDITISGGIKYFSDNDDTAFLLGLSIPIPVFDRNRGGVLESRYRLAKTADEARAAELKVNTALAVAYQALSTAHGEVGVLKDDILPQAASVFNAISEGYRQGKFHYLDVLDAQRTFFEVKGQYIETLAAYNKAVVEVEQLIGGPMDGVGKP